MIETTVKVDLSGLKRFQRVIEEDLRRRANGPIRRAIRQWGARYRSFAQQRFVTFSRGGGDWKDLADSTKARRRAGRKGKRTKKGRKGVEGAATGTFAILRDTGTLLAALAPVFSSKPGQLQQDIPFGVRVGYGGPGRHPRGKVTIADIASFHQEGFGNLPARKIIVPPDAPTMDRMAGDMERGLATLTKQCDVGGAK